MAADPAADGADWFRADEAKNKKEDAKEEDDFAALYGTDALCVLRSRARVPLTSISTVNQRSQPMQGQTARARRSQPLHLQVRRISCTLACLVPLF
jgi:hypothetical protein